MHWHHHQEKGATCALTASTEKIGSYAINAGGMFVESILLRPKSVALCLEMFDFCYTCACPRILIDFSSVVNITKEKLV